MQGPRTVRNRPYPVLKCSKKKENRQPKGGMGGQQARKKQSREKAVAVNVRNGAGIAGQP